MNFWTGMKGKALADALPWGFSKKRKTKSVDAENGLITRSHSLLERIRAPGGSGAGHVPQAQIPVRPSIPHEI